MKRNKPPVKLIQLNKKGHNKLRKYLYQKQKKTCPVLKKLIKYDDMVLDHEHKLKKDNASLFNGGLCRGLLDYRVNAFEGQALKKWKQSGLMDEIEFADLLINLGFYLKNPPCVQKYIHYTEKPKPKKLGIRDYNRIKKYYLKLYPNRRKIPEYPKAGIKKDKKGCIIYKARMTKKWEILLERVNEFHNQLHKGKKK